MIEDSFNAEYQYKVYDKCKRRKRKNAEVAKKAVTFCDYLV